MTVFKQRFLKHSGPIVSLLLVASMLIFQSACGGSETTNSNQPNAVSTNSNSEDTSAEANANTTSKELAKSMSQDPIENNLILVMKDWSGLEVATLERNSALSSMWLLTHSSSRPYDPQGIKTLIAKIRGNTFFKNTPRIKTQTDKLTRGFFGIKVTY